MEVDIVDYDPVREKAIQAAAKAMWPFNDWDISSPDGQEMAMNASAEGNLSGGEGEEEFTERLSLAIWRANGRFCQVSVNATYLENRPYETYSLDEDDYSRLIEDKHENQKKGQEDDADA